MTRRDIRFALRSQIPTDINELTDVDDLLGDVAAAESLTFSYTSGQVTGIDGTTIDIDITYNVDGTVNTVNNQSTLKTFAYNGNGTINTITVT